MKLAITSTGKDLDSQIDPRFGRCQYFIIVNTDTMEFEALQNNSATASGGAGIQAAQTVVEKNIDGVITGNLGPNAYQTLAAADIKLFTGASGQIRENLERFKNGEMNQTSSPTVGSHSGMGKREGSAGKGMGKGR